MRFQLELILRQAEGALTRVLGLAERRGFRPTDVDAHAQHDGAHWHLRMTVEGDRSGDGLAQQLAKQYDCLAVEVRPCP